MSGCRASDADIEQCVQKQERWGGVWCVVSIDDGFGFLVKVVRESYTFEAEFEAFDGRVLWSSHDMWER